MAFCEQCGARLTPGSRFCEECGAVVEVDAVGKGAGSDDAAQSFDTSFFKNTTWEIAWEKAASSCGEADLGLIVTRERALLKQTAVESREYNLLIDGYISNAKNRGVHYYYLNLEDCAFYRGEGDVDSVVEALRKVVSIARPKYLMILGNEEIIDVARWKNQAEDGDGEVESDLCYSTLDVNTPWNGQKYDFDEVMRVGRLPTFQNEGLQSFAAYFDGAMRYAGTMGRVIPYGLSALVWEDESNDEYKAISSDKVDVSPEVTKNNVKDRISPEANLLFFNLHGSNDTKYWYGQEGRSYPEAFDPSALLGRESPYFLGVEACYGARYLGGLVPDQSIVMTAMRNKCLAFLGSSKIAFGTPRPAGSCADIVIGDYIKCLTQGYSAGDAHLEGLKHLTSKKSLNDADIKTLAEFALYGDPSVRMMPRTSALSDKNSNGLGLPKGLHIPMPDVRLAVQMALSEVDAKIEAVIDDYVVQNVMPILKQVGLAAAEQKVYKMQNTGLNQKIYRYRSGDIVQVAKVYFDDGGKINTALISK